VCAGRAQHNPKGRDKVFFLGDPKGTDRGYFFCGPPKRIVFSASAQKGRAGAGFFCGLGRGPFLENWICVGWGCGVCGQSLFLFLTLVFASVGAVVTPSAAQKVAHPTHQATLY
jgi:hypothetical protein